MNYKNAATLGNEEHVFEKNYNQGLARVSKNTFRSYADLMYHVFEWLESRKKSNLLVKDFTPKLCNEFFVYLKEGRKIENKTFNKLRGYFSTVFNFYIKHQELSIKNPVHKVEHLRNEESDMHMPFTNGQMQLIKAAMIEKGDYQLLLFVSFIYYTFTRPGEEVRLLRVGDVLEKTIFIPSKRSKNNQGEHIAIPPGLERMIKEHRIREYPKEYFVFSHLGTPGPEQVSKDFFYQRHRKILQGLGLTGYTLYGYKHTGAINLYESTKDILTVQRHCRHYSSSQTDAYLRKYGVIVNMKVVSMPDFGGQALG
jgi:integrase